jgi:hypothetical protein
MVRAFVIGIGKAEREMKTSQDTARLRPGDVVAVRSSKEIFGTLDSDGTLDGLPFMPEMLEFCGKRFRLLNRVVQATIDDAFLIHHTESFVREFRNNDVVILTGVRCSGVDHDGCQRGCALFWKEAWLEKVDRDHDMSPGEFAAAGFDQLHSILKTRTDHGKYFCQSSEFLKATLHLSGLQRVQKCFSAVAAGNIGPLAMVKRVLVWMWWKSRTKLFGEHARGIQKNTPAELLDLQPGELVEVKSIQEIVSTLSKKGRNRGLHFSVDQRPFCGGRYRVRSRADRFISEGTGEMKYFCNTVILDDVLCDSACFAFGGCYRADFLYWREIWLRRVESQTNRKGPDSSLNAALSTAELH